MINLKVFFRDLLPAKPVIASLWLPVADVAGYEVTLRAPEVGKVGLGHVRIWVRVKERVGG